MAHDRSHVVISRGGVRAVLAVEPDPGRRLPALVHAVGHAVSHTQRTLQTPVRDLVLAMVEDLRRTQADGPLPELIADLVRARAPDATARVVPAVVLRPWPGIRRAGGADVEEIWPFDPESVALDLGLRRLIKREAVPGRGVVFESPDDAEIAAAHRAEEALARGAEADADADHAVAHLGDALGYPPCCVQAFLEQGRRDDLSLALALLPEPGGPPASPLTSWLVPPLALVSHAPCGLSCGATEELARALLDELDRRRPGFRSRWHGLAARVQAVSSDGRFFAGADELVADAQRGCATRPGAGPPTAPPWAADHTNALGVSQASAASASASK